MPYIPQYNNLTYPTGALSVNSTRSCRILTFSSTNPPDIALFTDHANASGANVTSFLVIPLRLHRARPRYSPRSSANVTCSDGVHLGVLNLQEMRKLSQQKRRRRSRRTLCFLRRHCVACHRPPRFDRSALLVCSLPFPLHWCYVWPRSTEAGGAITDELSPSGLSHTTGEELSSPSPLMALNSTPQLLRFIVGSIFYESLGHQQPRKRVPSLKMSIYDDRQ